MNSGRFRLVRVPGDVDRRREGCWSSQELGTGSRISLPGPAGGCRARAPAAAPRPGCTARGAPRTRRLDCAARLRACTGGSCAGVTSSPTPPAGRPGTHMGAASRRKPRNLAALSSPPTSLFPCPDMNQRPPQLVQGLYPFKKPDNPQGWAWSLRGTGRVAVPGRPDWPEARAGAARACAVSSSARRRREEGARVPIGRGGDPAREWRAVT